MRIPCGIRTERYYITPEGGSPEPACKAKPITGRTLSAQGVSSAAGSTLTPVRACQPSGIQVSTVVSLSATYFVKEISLTGTTDLDIIILLWCTINGTTRCKEVFIHGKDDIPAEQPLEKTDPRFPRSYENKSRPYCSEEKKSKGQKGIKCLSQNRSRRRSTRFTVISVSGKTGITGVYTRPAGVSATARDLCTWSGRNGNLSGSGL